MHMGESEKQFRNGIPGMVELGGTDSGGITSSAIFSIAEYDVFSRKTDLVNFFGHKSQDIYERGIFSLPQLWRQVIDSNGAYIIES